MEPIGSWVGRVAARYRMTVHELAQTYGLDIPFDRQANTWLLVSAMGGTTIEKLARLARVDAAVLVSIQEVQDESLLQRLAYCRQCLFLNPLDITSPCWKREWLEQSQRMCPIHGEPLAQLPITSLRPCGNFDKLLRVISRREQLRRARSTTPSYPR